MSDYDYLECQYSDGNLAWHISMVKEWLDPDIVLTTSESLNEETSTETFLIQEEKRRQLCYQVQIYISIPHILINNIEKMKESQ